MTESHFVDAAALVADAVGSLNDALSVHETVPAVVERRHRRAASGLVE